MNFNILAYSLYFICMSFIIVRVGWLFYKNGEVYIDQLFASDIPLGRQINSVLLGGYYLLNLGYVALSISSWDSLSNWAELIQTISHEVGRIVLILALMHYLNLFWISYFSSHSPRLKKKINEELIIKNKQLNQ